MNETETALIENAKEYFRNATSAEKREEYNTAVTLFFKTLAALADLMIYRKEKRLPSSHSERFRTLEEKYPDTYQKLDQNFSFYQDSYRRKMDAEISALLREDVKQLSEQLGISM